MFLFTHRCVLNPQGPLATNSRFEDIAGAYISVYVNFADLEGSLVLSQFYTKRAGWDIEEVNVMSRQIEREGVVEEDKPIYDEASQYGYCAVFSLWAKDANSTR